MFVRLLDLPDHLLTLILAQAGQEARLLCRAACSALRKVVDTAASWPAMTVLHPTGLAWVEQYQPQTLELKVQRATCLCLHILLSKATLEKITTLNISTICFPQTMLKIFPSLQTLTLDDPDFHKYGVAFPQVQRLSLTLYEQSGWRWLRKIPSTVTDLKITVRSGSIFFPFFPASVTKLEVQVENSAHSYVEFSFVKVLQHLKQLAVTGPHLLLTICFYDVPTIQEWSKWILRTTVNLPQTALVELDCTAYNFTAA